MILLALKDKPHALELAVQLAEQLAARQVQAYLEPTSAREAGRGQLAWPFPSWAQADLVVALGGLPPVREGQVYRLWLLAGDRRTDGGSLTPDAAGFASLVVQLPEFAYDSLGVSLEPDGLPSPGPRGPRVLFARLDAAQGW